MASIMGEEVTSEQKKNAQNIYAFLKSKGFNDVSACAILGNCWSESRMNPATIQKHDGESVGVPVSNPLINEEGGRGYGIIQWDGGRRRNLLVQASAQNVSWTSLDFQLNFLMAEINGDELKSFTSYGGSYQGVFSSWDDFKNTSDMYKATAAFMYCVERAGKTSSLPERQEAAKVFYEMFSGKDYEYNGDAGGNGSGSGGNSEENSKANPKLDEDGAASSPHVGYFEAGFIDFGDNNDITSGMLDELVKITNERRIQPLPYYDNIRYGSRAYMGYYHLQLGDACFTIPPEFISVSTESSSQAMTTIRQESSQKIKNGYSRRTVSVDLVFHGKAQINGYKVPSPEYTKDESTGKKEYKWYYVDGLRQLLAQFKCTPFLPITNLTINMTYGIYTVALQSIIVSTMPGYPNVMTAHLTLQEIDLGPYIECHNMFFKDMIDWDLFRFYYQRQLTESGEYGKLQSVPVDNKDCRIKLSVLNSNVFDSDIDYTSTKDVAEGDDKSTSFYDIIFDRRVVKQKKNGKLYVTAKPEKGDTNFETFIDSDEDKIHITEFHGGYSNMLTSVQLAELPHPTMQYIGGMDSTFQVSFETMDDTVVSQIQAMNDRNNSLIRNNRDFTGIGFIKIESELFQLFGTSFVYVDSITTSTVPGFPGLYTIQMQCIGYDAYQKDTEAINGHTPFLPDGDRDTVEGMPNEGKGTKADAITQSLTGLSIKILQDVVVEQKMRKYGCMYPDLKLPTYREVDDVIKQIRKFRKKHSTDEWPLSEYPLKSYPKNIQRMAHGIVEGKIKEDDSFVTNVPEFIESANQYDIYVDPDFYVFYPMTYKEMLNENDEIMEENGLGYTNVKPEARTDYFRSQYAVYPESTDSDISLSSGINNADVETMLELAAKQLGKDYVWGACGPDTFDCSGYVWWITRQCNIHSADRFTTGTMMNLTTINWNGVDDDGKPFFLRFSGAPGEMKAHANPGDILLCDDHTGFAYDAEQYIHASGGRHTNHHIRLTKYTDYCKFTKVLGIKKFYKNATEQKDNKDSTAKAASNNEPKGQKHSGKSEKKKNIKLEGTFHEGDSGNDVKKLQKALNRVAGTSLEADGEYGQNTKKAVKKFQKQWNEEHTDDVLEVDGIAGKKTIAALNKALKSDYSKSGSKTKISTSTTKKKVINAIDLTNIARAMCAKYYGRAEAKYLAMAQCIYDRITDPNANYGTLQTVLGSTLFGKMSEKDINKTPAYRCAKAVFNEGKRMFNKRCIYFTKDETDTKVKDNYKELGTFGKFTFYTDGKDTSSKKFKLKEDEDEPVTSSVSTETQERDDGANIIDVESTVTHGVTEADLAWISRFARPCMINADDAFVGDNSLLGCIFKNIGNIPSAIGNALSNEDDDKIYGTLQNTFSCQEQKYRTKFNTDDNILLTAFCDQAEYSAKGKLLKAFPTYFFSIVDEDGAWLDGRKLWANYYFLRSVVEIQAVAYDDNPAHFANITVSNAYGNMSHREPNAETYKIKNDDEYNGFQKWIYEKFGILPSFKGKKLTNELVERKNIIYKSMKIRAGCRCQLRMGYGSDPLGLPIVLNGFISDVTVGDIMSFACVSDGQELMNDIISDNPKDTNGIFKSQESSNMCMDVLTKRTSFLNALLPNYFENSKYGIEHFGLYFSEHAKAENIELFGIPIGKLNTLTRYAVGYLPLPGLVAKYNKEDDEWQTRDRGDGPIWGTVDTAGEISALVLNSASNIADGMTTIGKRLAGKLFWGDWKDIQYDICKNIYRGKYEGASHAIYKPFGGFFDGEKNIVFSQYNKTPWDVIQISAQNVSEFIGYPLYHQFESRLFLGLPWFLNKYRYDIINGNIYEEAKTAAQVHFIDSLTDIIDNQMTCTRRGVDTNAIVMYVQAKAPKATPTLYTDRTIDPAYQSTKIYDSSVSQNLIGPDALWNALGIHMGEDGAVRLGISQLLINWAKAYKGDIIIIGDGSIKPYDYIYLNDRFNNINGMCTARCVTHTFTAATGFVTTFVPGMIGFSAKQNSSGNIVIANYMSLCSAFAYFTSLKKACIENSEMNHTMYGITRDSIGFFGNGIEILLGAKIYTGIRLGPKVIKGFGTIAKAANAAYHNGTYVKVITSVGRVFSTLTTKLSKVKSLGEIGRALLAAGRAIKAPGILGGAIGVVSSAFPHTLMIKIGLAILVNVVLKKIIDYFQYQHCISVLPLHRNNMCYIPTTYGRKFIITGDENNPAYEEAEKMYAGDEPVNKSIQTGEDKDYEIKTTEDEED